MFYCFLCKHNFGTITELMRHLRKRHALYEGSTLTLKCFNENCSKAYESFSGYRKHIKSCVLNKENLDSKWKRERGNSNIRSVNKLVDKEQNGAFN